MNNEQIEQNAAAVAAYLRGEPVEFDYENKGQWTESRDPSWSFTTGTYRPKPAPKTRDWNCAADVPLNCWLREINGHAQLLVVGVSRSGFSISAKGVYDWSEFTRTAFEYSTDRVTWKPCLVEEVCK